MVKTDLQANDGPATAETSNRPQAGDQPETTLKDILDTLHDSDFFPRTGKDAPSRFWSAYERVARQYDEELIERHNGEMDVLLIFAGLFSAVSSAFIVNMQSSLSPSASDTTNAILMILVNKIDNNTFPAQEATLPVWTGPSNTTIWIQTLAYASLSSSLLAAFGAMLAKQWLGHFKTSRFGRGGALHERCQTRQKKFDGLEAWHFSTVLATLPIFLQLSLFFFGVALAANIWTMQHTVASVIMVTTAFGVIFTFFTLVSSLRSPDCPFQTPVSTMSHHILHHVVPFRARVRETWEKRPKSWADFLDLMRKSWMGLSDFLREFSGRVLHTANDLISRWITPFVAQLTRMFSLMRQFRSTPADAEAAGGPEQVASAGSVPLTPVPAREETASLTGFDLNMDLDLDLPVETAQVYAVQSSAVQWILETSTDMDNIAAAVGMLPEIEWPAEDNVKVVFEQLESHFRACFDPTRQILPLAQARATACLKAMCHVDVEQNMKNLFYLFPDGYIASDLDPSFSYCMVPDQGFLVVSCTVDTLDLKLDMASVPLYDRMWMAHMFTYRLYNGGDNPDFVDFVIRFIGTCLGSKAPTRLAADCVLLAGLLLGGKFDRQHLARLDKSKVINELRELVFNHMLGVLVGDIVGNKETALKLIHPLLQDWNKHIHFFDNDCLVDWALIFCCHLLEEGMPGEDHIRSNSIACLIQILNLNRHLLKMDSTPAQYDMLVDYHLHICEGTDHDAVTSTFGVLNHLGGSPSTPDRMRHYIDTTIHFMGHESTCLEALYAAFRLRSAVASMGQDDESLREHFSKALASMVLSFMCTPRNSNPFTKITFFSFPRDLNYLVLLHTLAQEITWQPQLHQTGHFDNCLAIAKTLSTDHHPYYDQYAVPVAHIFAIIDDSDQGHPLLQACPSWPLLLRAWRFIFNLDLFGGKHKHSIYLGNKVTTADCLTALPSLVSFARRHCDDQDEALLAVVEQVCSEIDKEMQQHEQTDREGMQHIVPRYPALGEQIRQLLKTAWNDHLPNFMYSDTSLSSN